MLKSKVIPQNNSVQKFSDSFRALIASGKEAQLAGLLFSTYKKVTPVSIPDGQYPVEYLCLYLQYALRLQEKPAPTSTEVTRAKMAGELFVKPELWDKIGAIGKYESFSGITLTVTNGGDSMALKQKSASASQNGGTDGTEKKRKGVAPLAIKFLCEKKYTDEEIRDLIKQEIPDAKDELCFIQIASRRRLINNGGIPDLKQYAPIERLMKNEAGEVVPYARTKKEKKNKIDPETDPLNTIAGLGIGKEKNKAEATAKAPAKTPAKTLPKKPDAKKTEAKKTEAKKPTPKKK